jgi:hypothetical protein
VFASVFVVSLCLCVCFCVIRFCVVSVHVSVCGEYKCVCVCVERVRIWRGTWIEILSVENEKCCLKADRSNKT